LEGRPSAGKEVQKEATKKYPVLSFIREKKNPKKKTKNQGTNNGTSRQEGKNKVRRLASNQPWERGRIAQAMKTVKKKKISVQR